MARTKGHGNPNWTRDETILALALYFASGERVPSKSAPEVGELSALLRSLPYHQGAARQPTFRNPEGVAFKLQNIRQVATGKGLGNVSRVDRTIWEEFGDKPHEVAQLAAAIRSGVSEFANADEPAPEEEFSEGRLLTALHERRERNRALRDLLLKKRLSDGLRCEMCGFHRPELPQDLQGALFEVHHNLPLSSGGERRTRVEDLSLLCACCHRLIHRLIARERRWVSPAEARRVLALLPPAHAQDALPEVGLRLRVNGGGLGRLGRVALFVLAPLPVPEDHGILLSGREAVELPEVAIGDEDRRVAGGARSDGDAIHSADHLIGPVHKLHREVIGGADALRLEGRRMLGELVL